MHFRILMCFQIHKVVHHFKLFSLLAAFSICVLIVTVICGFYCDNEHASHGRSNTYWIWTNIYKCITTTRNKVKTIEGEEEREQKKEIYIIFVVLYFERFYLKVKFPIRMSNFKQIKKKHFENYHFFLLSSQKYSWFLYIIYYRIIGIRTIFVFTKINWKSFLYIF